MGKKETQRELILKYCQVNNGISTKDANDLCKHFYYCNHEHYVSEILSRLVGCGKLERISKGKYILGKGKVTYVAKDVSQTQLFQ